MQLETRDLKLLQEAVARLDAGFGAMPRLDSEQDLVRRGEFAESLGRCRQAAVSLFNRLSAAPSWLTAMAPDLDIVVWAPRRATATELSAASRKIFEVAAREGLHLALCECDASLMQCHWSEIEWDRPTVTCLRSCLMKPEHLDWMDDILERLSSAAEKVK